MNFPIHLITAEPSINGLICNFYDNLLLDGYNEIWDPFVIKGNTSIL